MRLLFFVIFILFSTFSKAQIYDVRDYGAVNDGETLNTKAIQEAINVCTKNGGGKVLLTGGGKYMTGTIYLKDNVALHISNGTVLLGSPHYEHYASDTFKNMYKNEPHMDRCLIFAKDTKSIAIEGYGTIDGNGYKENFSEGRPMMIRAVNSSKIHLTNITLINPASWTSAWLYCNDITVSGIKIVSRVNTNGDGLDFDGCSNVNVSNSTFDNSDDSICLQASRPDTPCKNISISNCHFTTQWGGMRIGLLSRGTIESVTVTNCTFRDIKDSGLKIQQNEGGEMRNMTFSNLVMNNVPRPIFMTFTQQRASVETTEGTYEPLKRMHNFMFDTIIVDNSEGDVDSAIFLTGMPGHYIEDINISNVQFIVSGGGTHEQASKTNLKEYSLDVLNGWWPEFSRIGTLPASGIFARHIDGLHLDNISIRTVNEDFRKPVVFDDVLNASYNNLRLNRQEVSKVKILK